MSKSLFEIEGFADLEKTLKKLGDDKTKRREVLKILGQLANSTKKKAQELAPAETRILRVRSRSYLRKKRVVGGSRSKNKKAEEIEENYTPGLGKKSIGKKVMRRAKNPMLVVRANNTDIGGYKGYGGFYMRQWVIRGTKKFKGNPFMDKAYSQTKGGVIGKAEQQMARYFQKQIKRLGL